MSNRMTGALLLAPLALLLIVFFFLPVGIMFPMSLREYIPGTGISSDYSLFTYQSVLTDSYYQEALMRTLWLGVVVTALCMLIGYPLGYYLARTTSRFRVVYILLVIFPLLLNLVVRSYGWIVLLANRGLINTTLMELGLITAPLKLIYNFTGVTIALVHIYVPFVVLTVMSSVRNIPVELESASQVLGASRTTTFCKVTLPLSAPGLLAGSILVFVLTVSALVTPRMLGGSGYQVMATLIYDRFVADFDWPAGSALSFILTFVVVAVIAASTWFFGSSRKTT